MWQMKIPAMWDRKQNVLNGFEVISNKEKKTNNI
jgi:hypothetical protein